MPITILDRFNAANIGHTFDYVISILDSKDIEIKDFGNKHLIVYFQDTEFPTDTEFSDMLNAIKIILSWAESNQITINDKLLVHCHAGVSRSSAVAWFLLIKLGKEDYRTAFQTLYKARPSIWPNTKVLEIADTLLGLNGELTKLSSLVNAEISSNRNDYLGYGG